MIKRKLKLTLFMSFIIIGLICGFLIAKKIYNPDVETSTPWIAPNLNNPSTKFIVEETLINQIQQKKELISLEIDLTEKVIIDNSWGGLDIFKKVQNVYFVAKGMYSIDLSKIDKDKITIDNDSKIITILSPKPYVKAVTMDEQKTIYETPQNGVLRIGEIKLTPAEYQSLLNEAKEKMREKLNSDELFSQAVKSSEWAIKDLIKTLLQDTYEYNLKIEFEE